VVSNRPMKRAYYFVSSQQLREYPGIEPSSG
jgi:hypothetical protein